ncbi:hypothetical protein GCM10023160_25780 [Brachybacterium paraconglomeratum]
MCVNLSCSAVALDLESLSNDAASAVDDNSREVDDAISWIAEKPPNASGDPSE